MAKFGWRVRQGADWIYGVNEFKDLATAQAELTKRWSGQTVEVKEIGRVELQSRADFDASGGRIT